MRGGFCELNGWRWTGCWNRTNKQQSLLTETLLLVFQFDRNTEFLQASLMKATFDLPAELVRKMTLRAAHEGRKVEDVAAELLKRALAPEKTPRSAHLATKGMIKLPLFPSPKTAPASRMSTAELLALEQETLHQEDLQRLGLSL